MAMLAGVKGLGLACLHVVRRIQARPETQIIRLGTLASGITARRFLKLISTQCFSLSGRNFELVISPTTSDEVETLKNYILYPTKHLSIKKKQLFNLLLVLNYFCLYQIGK